MHSTNISKTGEEKSRKAHGLGHVTPMTFGVHPNASRKRVEIETWNLVHRCTVAISQKSRKEKSRKGRDLSHVTPINFGVHPNASRKRVEIETWKLVHGCTVAMSQKPAKKNLEKRRGLGHVTPINFGVHPNLSPKRVDLETWSFSTQTHCGNISKISKEKSRKGAWPRSRDPHKFWRTP